jgi:hypothetical protein
VGPILTAEAVNAIPCRNVKIPVRAERHRAGFVQSARTGGNELAQARTGFTVVTQDSISFPATDI